MKYGARRGLGGFTFFGHKCPPLLSDAEADAMVAAVNRIRSGQKPYGEPVRLQEVRRRPNFSESNIDIFRLRQALDA